MGRPRARGCLYQFQPPGRRSVRGQTALKRCPAPRIVQSQSAEYRTGIVKLDGETTHSTQDKVPHYLTILMHPVILIKAPGCFHLVTARLTGQATSRDARARSSCWIDSFTSILEHPNSSHYIHWSLEESMIPLHPQALPTRDFAAHCYNITFPALSVTISNSWTT